MPHWRPPCDHDAAERARAWLAAQHNQAHAQVLQLLGEAPIEAINQALGSLSTAELRSLYRHLTAATQRRFDQPDSSRDGT